VLDVLAHVEQYSLGATDLIFRFDTFQSTAPGRRLRAVEDLGRTGPNAAGRTYSHGSLSAYTAGRCRCLHCRAAFAEYRAARRAGCSPAALTSRSSKERLGHGSIATTGKYLHTLPTADETALAALRRIRGTS
jgi:hypothetical protein